MTAVSSSGALTAGAGQKEGGDDQANPAETSEHEITLVQICGTERVLIECHGQAVALPTNLDGGHSPTSYPHQRYLLSSLYSQTKPGVNPASRLHTHLRLDPFQLLEIGARDRILGIERARMLEPLACRREVP